MARIAATEHRTRFPGPMLEVPWHVQPGHCEANAKESRRLLIPALAMALDERGVTLGKPTYSALWRAANTLSELEPEPSPWLLDAYRRPMTRAEMAKAYERACVLISDIVAYDWGRDAATLLRQPAGRWPRFVHQIARWTDTSTDGSMDEEERCRLRMMLLPTRDPTIREPDPPPLPPDVPFTWSELRRVYGQRSHPSNAEKWVVYTDGSVAQRGGRTMGAFAGTFTQGPDTPMDFAGRVVEHPLSSTRMEMMAIIAAIAITPPDAELEINTDSQAAAHMMTHAEAPTIPRELANSPDAFLWLHLRSWLQSRQAPVAVKWVQGHSGVAGNERADHLATLAHDDPSATRWTTRMPPPPDTLLDHARRPSHPKKTSAPPPRAR